MTITKKTLFFALTTAPTQGVASPRSGGWSESFWVNANPYNPFTFSTLWPRTRAALLPPQAAIVGARDQIYTINGNKLVPGGSTVYKGGYIGSSGLNCDVPQMALMCDGTTAGINQSRMTLRGIPDSVIVNGEYQPGLGFQQAFNAYVTALLEAPAFGSVGRDLSQVAVRINGIAVNQLTTASVIPGLVNDSSYVRFVHARDDNGKPITGSYLVTAGAGTTLLTLANLNVTMTRPNGLLRLDQIVFSPFIQVLPIKSVVRKIGRPSSGYRGRASKRRVH
jgi:hypothetical protein